LKPKKQKTRFLQRNTKIEKRKQLVELSFENELCGAFDEISNDKSYRNFNELA
jgi:hypothetical protein